jgi:hypothetical protein
MTHDEFVFSWRREWDAEGDRDRSATEEDTQTYKFGIIPGDNIPIPRPVAEDPVEEWQYNLWRLAAQSQGPLKVPHTWSYYLVNAIPYYYALGESSNSAPSYFEHEISGIDSGHLPTRTFHYEGKGGTTDILLDFVGRKTTSLVSSCMQGGFLTVEETTVGARGTGKNAVYGTGCTNASESAVEYTNAPIFPVTANVEPYMMNEYYTCTWDTDAQTIIKGVTMSITTPMEPVDDNEETVDEYLVAQKRWPLSNWETGKRFVLCNWFVAQDDKLALQDQLDALSTKSLDVKFQRGTNDYILWELDSCQVLDPKPTWPGMKGLPWYNHFIKVGDITITERSTLDHTAAPGFFGVDARP